MALTEETVTRGRFYENGNVQVSTITKIMRDGVQIADSIFSKVIAPGDDYSKEADCVKSICMALHTPEVVSQYKSATAEKLEVVEGVKK